MFGLIILFAYILVVLWLPFVIAWQPKGRNPSFRKAMGVGLVVSLHLALTPFMAAVYNAAEMSH